MSLGGYGLGRVPRQIAENPLASGVHPSESRPLSRQEEEQREALGSMPSESTVDRPLWLERLAADWARRRSPSSAAVVAAVAILVVGALDGAAARLMRFDFVATVFYIVPIGFAAWAAGPRTGVACAAFAGAVETGAMAWASHGAMRAWLLVVGIGLELPVFLGAAFTFARLRWHLDRQRLLSRTDPLTGIGNERTLDEAIRLEMARMARRPAPISIVYLDVDHLKALNDSRGHSAGNELLRLVGMTLKSAIRAADTAARVGGDEFALLLPETGPAACGFVVERVRDTLRRTLRHAGFTNTFSVGAVTYEGPPPGVDEILIAADRAMYQVKNSSKDGVRYEVVPAVEAAAGFGEARRASPSERP